MTRLISETIRHLSTTSEHIFPFLKWLKKALVTFVNEGKLQYYHLIEPAFACVMPGGGLRRREQLDLSFTYVKHQPYCKDESHVSRRPAVCQHHYAYVSMHWSIEAQSILLSSHNATSGETQETFPHSLQWKTWVFGKKSAEQKMKEKANHENLWEVFMVERCKPQLLSF